ncbi:MAG: GAF domain-containing protein [Prevotellaceae bacterium]|jgi:GAF domain-containing protein|nr:GAF domain-containing protein [Prevotellaceae bacterium]
MTKKQQYEALLPKIDALLAAETDMIANMANTTALLHETFQFLWVGFYIVRQRQLILGPFQGPVACTRIAPGRGVCGAAYTRGATIIVPDVAQYPGHIACNPRSKSEIVVPLIAPSRRVIALLDIDSDTPAAFDDTDRTYLERILHQWPTPRRR